MIKPIDGRLYDIELEDGTIGVDFRYEEEGECFVDKWDGTVAEELVIKIEPLGEYGNIVELTEEEKVLTISILKEEITRQEKWMQLEKNKPEPIDPKYASTVSRYNSQEVINAIKQIIEKIE